MQRLTPVIGFKRKGDLFLASSDEDSEFVEAEDFEALQVLFSKYCDKEGLMTKNAVEKVPAIADLLVSCVCRKRIEYRSVRTMLTAHKRHFVRAHNNAH